jgi:hypothetical protein
MTTEPEFRGFALLIKAPRTVRRLVRGEGDTIAILDEHGKEIWNVKIPGPIDDPGIRLHQVRMNLVTERDFVDFCKKTWERPEP